MAKDEDEYIRMRGTVLKMLPDSTFEVQLEGGLELLAKPSGRMRRGRGIQRPPWRHRRRRGVDLRPDPGSHRLALPLDPAELASTSRSPYGICQGPPA